MSWDRIKDAIKKAGSAVGSALSQDDSAGPEGGQRPFNLIVTIPITAPDKKLVEDQCAQAGKRVEKLKSILLSAASIDARVKLAGEATVRVENR